MNHIFCCKTLAFYHTPAYNEAEHSFLFLERMQTMKKWYDEEFSFTVDVVGYLRGDKTEGYCRNGEQTGDRYTCTYGCPVNQDGYGICSKTMLILFPLMEVVRSGGDLRNAGGESRYEKTVVCPDGCVIFHLKAEKRETEKGNFYTGRSQYNDQKD